MCSLGISEHKAFRFSIGVKDTASALGAAFSGVERILFIEQYIPKLFNIQTDL
jgi:hypothetical protein